ncbi:hypothetical protein UlMin_024820 [Ulmus minor]
MAAVNMAFFSLLMVLGLFLVSGEDNPPGNQKQDHVVAIAEMQRANYFTFVTLLNMARFDQRLQGNITFLMPNDRMLSKITLPQEAVIELLLRHSIPSPLLFDHLQRLPTGSIIPSSKPDYLLKISNNGRRSFFLNNVKLISPNLCTEGSSIRCHGIDGVLLESIIPIPVNNSTITLSPPCLSSTIPPPLAIPPTPSPSLPSPSMTSLSPAPAPAPIPPPTQRNVTAQKSGSDLPVSLEGFLRFSVICMLVSTLVSL